MGHSGVIHMGAKMPPAARYASDLANPAYSPAKSIAQDTQPVSATFHFRAAGIMRGTFRCALFMVSLAGLSLTGASRPVAADAPGGLCCLCMCHAADESKCTRACVKMQHGTKIIEEPEMKTCTRSCLQKGVTQVFFSPDGSSYVIVTR